MMIDDSFLRELEDKTERIFEVHYMSDWIIEVTAGMKSRKTLLKDEKDKVKRTEIGTTKAWTARTILELMYNDNRTTIEVKEIIRGYMMNVKTTRELNEKVKKLKVEKHNLKATIKFKFTNRKIDKELGRLLALDGREK